MSKWMPSNVGAEPKKLALLGGLIVTLGVVFWISRSSDSTPAPTPRPAPAAPAGIPGLPAPEARPSQPSLLQRRAKAGGSAAGRSIEDFRPSVKLAEGTDVSQIDPSLRVELLAKVRSGEAAGGTRSLFEFSQAPAPPPDKVKPIVPAPKPVEVTKMEPPVEPPKPPGPPPPPPITLKYYGFAGKPQSNQRRAFFLDGEDIFVAGENELVRSRYKIIRIGVNSALVEDTTNKNQQTLPLVEEGG